MKAFAVVLIITATVVAGVMGYRARTQNTTHTALPIVKYGFIPFPGTFPYLVAIDKGFFQEEGVDVVIVDEEDYTKMNEKVATGAIDFQSQYVLIDVVDAVSRGKDLKVVMATDFSNGADAIVAKKTIETVVDLKGKKVGVASGTLSQYLLSDALKKFKLTLADVTQVDLSSLDAASAFIAGEVDAAVSWEPDVSKAVNEGNGVRLYTSVESPGLIIDTLAFRSEFVKLYPERVAGVVRGYMKAMDFIAKNPDAAYEIGANYSKISPAEFSEQLKGVKLMTKDDNASLMVYKSSIDSLHGAVNQANQFLKDIGVTTATVDSTQIIDPTFIRGLNK